MYINILTFEIYMKLTKPFFIFLLLFTLGHSATASTYPYLSNGTYRTFADHVIDPITPFDPSNVKKNDVIFVEASILYFFLK